MRKNSPKNQRVNQEVAHELAGIIRDLKDPRISFMTTVMDAYVAPDLKTCKVYISVLGSEEAKKGALAALKSASGFIRREIGHRLNLRNTPEFTFVADDSIEYGAHINEILKDL